jgi:hypothetical protein
MAVQPGPAAPHAVARPGLAAKAPQFYEFFTGRRDPGLNARMATARAGRGVLNLAGVMRGAIDTHPATPDGSSFYVFGVDRGTTAVTAPFPGRPNVKFDAVVAVSVQPSGITASVTDLAHPGGPLVTTLDPSAARVRGDRVQVSVPLGLLTADAALPVRGWGINLWPRTALPPKGDFHTVASFVPEDATFPVAVAGRGR